MAYRGRLIHPLLVRIRHLNKPAIRAAERYDDILRAPVPDVSTGVIRDARDVLPGEDAFVELHAQVEDEAGSLRMRPTGDDADIRFRLIFHLDELRTLGLIDADTQFPSVPAIGDRLEDMRALDGTLRWAPPNPYKIVCVEGEAHGGLGGDVNLWITRWTKRDLGAQR
jgi:hypothetical protein